MRNILLIVLVSLAWVSSARAECRASENGASSFDMHLGAGSGEDDAFVDDDAVLARRRQRFHEAAGEVGTTITTRPAPTR